MNGNWPIGLSHVLCAVHSGDFPSTGPTCASALPGPGWQGAARAALEAAVAPASLHARSPCLQPEIWQLPGALAYFLNTF